MSAPPHSIEDIIPFIFYNTPNDSSVGTDALLDGSGNIDYQLPPYRLTDADVVPTPGRPLLTVSPSERGPLPLMPFVRIPARIRRTDPLYLATILDRAVPVFETIQRSYAFIPHSRAQMVVLAGLLRLVSAVSQIVPARVQSGWTAFLPANEPATPQPGTPCYSFISSVWLFPGTEEFPMDQPLRDPLSLADHTTLLRIARPNLRVLELLINEFRAGHLSPTITHIIFNSVRALIAALPSEMRDPVWLDHLLPESPDHANRVLTPRLLIPSPPPRGSIVGTISSHGYSQSEMRARIRRPHITGRRLPLRYRVRPQPVSAFDTSWTSARGSPSKPEATADARTTPTLPEMQVDPQDTSPEDARAIAEALAADEPAPVLRPRPARSTVRGRKTTRGKAPSAPSSSAANVDLRGRPLIRVRSSRKSVTPPVDEAYNEEGEEEREDDEDEELTPPRKRKRTDPVRPKAKAKAKSGHARAFLSFPPPPCARPGASPRRTSSPRMFLSSALVPTMDTVRLAAESLAKEQSDAHRVRRRRDASPIARTFTVPEHVQAANYIEPYARLSNQRGNELLLDLSAARADYELARESLFRASSRLAVTSNRVGAWIREVTACWAQLSIDYRAAILQYPFLSDTRRSDPPPMTSFKSYSISSRGCCTQPSVDSSSRGELELARRGRGGIIGFEDRVKQRAFLDEKTVALEGFSTMIPAIARDKSLYDVFFNMKNSYHQTATGPGGIIGGRYPTILDLVPQAHRTELEDARVAAEEQAAAEAAATAKPKKSKGKKSKKSKAIVEDIDDEVSVFDDSEFPMTGSGEVDDPMQIDAERVEEGTTSASHCTTQSLDAHTSAFPVTPTPTSGPVTADFPVPPPRKHNRTQSYAHEDSADQYAAAELATNGPAGPKDHRRKSEIRSRIGFSNAQLRYLLEHREYLLKDLSRDPRRATPAHPSRILGLGRTMAGLRWWRTLAPTSISWILECHSVPLLGPAISAKRLGISIVNAPSWTPINSAAK
ncbi:hypothetical protein B0H14DRAFT_3477914 [Mycena olivaceomarginata]|nr:hypothetical protein B0H14DRAFT_3477914 [Mycena olivaceomarginata]